MPFCISCGKENKETAKFCTSCGKPLQRITPTIAPNQASIPRIQVTKKKASPINSKVVIALAALLLLIAVFVIIKITDNGSVKMPQTEPTPVTQPSNPIAKTENIRVNETDKRTDTPAVAPKQDVGSAPVQDIKNVIEGYYALIDNNDCLSINSFYEPVLENYYNRMNIDRSEVLTDCITYRKRWPYTSASVDYNTLQVTNISNGGYLVTYHLTSALRKEEMDEWKIYNLFITIIFTSDLKIKSIYEIKQSDQIKK